MGWPEYRRDHRLGPPAICWAVPGGTPTRRVGPVIDDHLPAPMARCRCGAITDRRRRFTSDPLFHGGGNVVGDRHPCKVTRRRASAAWWSLSGHRLAPEHKFPGSGRLPGGGDFLRADGAGWDIRADRTVAGDSAGARWPATPSSPNATVGAGNAGDLAVYPAWSMPLSITAGWSIRLVV